ncbi:hypothetical protein FB565_006582 [Actinoplanes lutulentus]|uniref:Uncharacterized protein n=1 Tax=Actinoplanes lutulentus TaxID=1287878 RepID=A0A327Z9T1_9ACTN|nr:hypothetical protein [Actinoplanes lutulentus]MBB2946814.1 hypothetical protein [Actinoplanes lutulentus]RAK35706.1 hypothetical protein B0I29_109180 [Actinoplanes lutulentus]
MKITLWAPGTGFLDIGADDVGVTEAELVIWRAETDDSGYAWRKAGIYLLASAIPMVLIFCAGGLMGAIPNALWLSLLLIPVGAIFGIREILMDRRAIVAVELRNNAFTVTGSDHRRTSYPAREVSRIDVVRNVYDGRPSNLTMRLHAGGRVLRTRPGPPDLPEGWADAVRIAEVEMAVRDKHHRDS